MREPTEPVLGEQRHKGIEDHELEIPFLRLELVLSESLLTAGQATDPVT